MNIQFQDMEYGRYSSGTLKTVSKQKSNKIDQNGEKTFFYYQNGEKKRILGPVSAPKNAKENLIPTLPTFFRIYFFLFFNSVLGH